MNVTIYNNIADTKGVDSLPLKDVLENIYNGAYLDEVMDYRDAVKEFGKDSKEAKSAKLALTNFTGSGTFSERKDGCLIQHSGFIVIDFDKVNEIILSDLKERLEKDPYTYSVFYSASGKGLAVVVKIDGEKHREAFLSLERYYFENYSQEIDASCKNESRTRFVSYDPELIIKENSESFTRYIKDEKKNENSLLKAVNKAHVKDPFELIEQIFDFQEKKNPFEQGNRNSFIFKLACNACRFNVQKESLKEWVFNSLETNNDFTPEECERCIENGYRSAELDPKREVQFAPPQGWEEIAKLYSFLKSFEKNDETIWYISELDFIQWLSDQGFGVYFRGSDMLLIRIVDGIIYDCTREKLKNWVFSYFAQYPALQAKIIKKKGLLGPEKMPYLPNLTDKIVPIRDTKDNSFIFFQNGYLEITAESVGKLEPYEKLEFLVYESDILKYEYEEKPYHDFDFVKFCINVCNEDLTRLKFLMTSIGYMLHTYKDPLNAKSIVLVDEGSNPDESNGGTGKSLISKAISKIRPTVFQDGKRFGKNNIRFLYQDVKESTKILAIDDIDRYFNWAFLFSAITAGIQVEQKGLQPFIIDFDQSPKILITTNYMVRQNDESTKRRFVEIELFPHYSSTHSPADEFEKAFFNDWDSNDWNMFFSFMADCLRIYLSEGIQKVQTEKAVESKIATMTCNEFAEFAKETFSYDTEYDFKYQMDAFVLQNPDFLEGKNKMTHKKWSIWLRAFASATGCQYETWRKKVMDQKERKFIFRNK